MPPALFLSPEKPCLAYTSKLWPGWETSMTCLAYSLVWYKKS